MLESVAYALDGAPIFTKVDANGDLDKREEFEIFNGRIVPGKHQIAVRLVYRGHGYGIFSYLEGYKFKVQSSYTFNAEAGKVTTVKVVGYEKGGITADLKDRPGRPLRHRGRPRTRAMKPSQAATRRQLRRRAASRRARGASPAPCVTQLAACAARLPCALGRCRVLPRRGRPPQRELDRPGRRRSPAS